MANDKPPIFNRVPYNATITVTQNTHIRKDANDRGYYDIHTAVDAGTLLDVTVSADSLEALRAKIAAHVALIE